jgi:hypothetical protein
MKETTVTQTIILKSGTEAILDGVCNIISFKHESINVHVGFSAEYYSFDLMIEDGTESEIYPSSLHTKNVTESELLNFNATKSVRNTESLIVDIKLCVDLLNPRCSRKEAYHGH